MKIWFNGNDTVIAEDEKDASKVMEELIGEPNEDEQWIEENFEMFSVITDDLNDAENLLPLGGQIEYDEEAGKAIVSATYEQWLTIGRCFLGSLDY